MESSVKERDYYREKLIGLINTIDRADILEYIYRFIVAKFKLK